MNKEKLKKIEDRVTTKVEDKILSLKIFDEPRPNYVSKITFTDRFFADTILKFVPYSVRPNFLTVFRFISIPFLIFFLLNNNYQIAFWLFFISAFTDAFDGALARTRNQITDWGMVFDPLADKLLIASVGGILIFNFLSPILAVVIILIELLLIGFAYYRFKGEIVPAKTVGKIKTILQCVGVGFIFLFLLIGSQIFLTVASGLLYLSVIFSVLSLLIYKSI